MLINDEKNLKLLIDKQKVYKEALNNRISDDEARKFVDALFENYFLDNDNINFLVSNGVNFFNIDNNEQCFCLSNKQFKDCCFKSLKKTKKKEYLTFLKAIVNKEEYPKYLEYSNNLYLKHYRALGKDEVCHFINCEKNAVENNLYKINFEEESYLSTYRKNVFDNHFPFGEIFFNNVNNNTFNFYGFCSEHFNYVKNIDIRENSSDSDLKLVNYSSLLFKLFNNRVYLSALKEEFYEIFNSLDSSLKPLYVYNLKKVSNKVSSLLNLYSRYKECLREENDNFKILKFSLPKSNNFLVFDLMYPQVTPEDFKMVNSINNVFLEEKAALISMFKTDKGIFSTIIYNKKDEQLNSYFDQYLKIMEGKQKNYEFFITNCALILCDNIILNKSFFEKFNEGEQIFYSALNKFRFEHPNMGQEYLKMKFFAGFIKGNNFF
ncbi:hypothetical protein SLITO_v1c03830 [Spiroplasma litorale]|uniref:Uncharacterized protein n=1 Tax=Spiroplasma litorale TaxID=216942 RepID=A0A0K1W1H7_9MOLU|nr:SEC-C domain-containing protein [Spiroplasma litorale]AKX34036.1 hypothetical protein SLITO_v1c03830 [Spiroplasma litorale]